MNSFALSSIYFVIPESGYNNAVLLWEYHGAMRDAECHRLHLRGVLHTNSAMIHLESAFK